MKNIRDRIRLGFDAQRRYLTAYASGRPPQGSDFRTADRQLAAALRELGPDDPMRVGVSFGLGQLRLAEHQTRCGDACQAVNEFVPIVELLGVAGRRLDAADDHLSLYAIAVDKLYDHTHDPADIDLAIEWLRRAAAREASGTDRRRMLISLAIQHSNRGSALRLARRFSSASESEAAFLAAIDQFQAVLVELAEPSSQTDPARDADTLDALLGMLEVYYARADERPSDADLDIMAGLGRQLCAAMTPDYRLRAYALGRSGTAVVQSITRRIGNPWDAAVIAFFMQQQNALEEALTRVPGLDADLDLAIDALTRAAGLEDRQNRRLPLFMAVLCAARTLRYAAHGADEDLRAVGRLSRAVMASPNVGASYQRQCGEYLLLVLAMRLRSCGIDFDSAVWSGKADDLALPPSSEVDLDTMIGLLERFARTDGGQLAPALSATLAMVTSARSAGQLADSELAALHARQLAAANTAETPAMRSYLRCRAAATGAEWVRRGTAPARLADEIAATFEQAKRGFPAGHPMARHIADLASAFETEQRRRPTTPVGPAARRAEDPVQAAKSVASLVPTALDTYDAFNPRVAPLLGAGSHGLLGAPAGRVIEVVEALLSAPPRDVTGLAAVRSVLALAMHTRWLAERGDADVGAAIDQVSQAIGKLPDGHPLQRRLAELLAVMLLDRCQVYGDHADADAAIAALEKLIRQQADSGPLPNLGSLLAEACASSGLAGLGELLTGSAGTGAVVAAHRDELGAAIGSGLVVRALLTGDDHVPARAIKALGNAVERLPADHPRHPDARSDLGLACLINAQARDDAVEVDKAMRALLATAADCPADHPRRSAILLRAAGALTADGAAGYRSDATDQGIDLLTDALRTAGLFTAGERARCLYGLSYLVLRRYERAHDAADLELAISSLNDALAGLDSAPGDPLAVPLLRTLAVAYRQAAPAGPGLRRTQSRSTGKSVLHVHARAVLLQSGSPAGLAATRSIGADTLRVAEWCLADGKPDSAIEALELGRGLVLHAATVAADVPAMLREANLPDLADEWAAMGVAAASGKGRPLGAVPSDLRHRVMTALTSGTAERRLLSAPNVTQIAAAVQAARMDALVYLVPASSEGGGRALIVEDTGAVGQLRLPELSAEPGGVVARYQAARRDLSRCRAEHSPDLAAAHRRCDQALGDLCDWAWRAAIGPVHRQLARMPGDQIPLRLVIAPVGILGIVPWHAARRRHPDEPASFRYACADVVFSSCASARQLIEATARQAIPRANSAVFVADPTGDLKWSRREAEAIGAALYPGAVYLGPSEATAAGGSGDPGRAGGASTPDELLGCLPAANPEHRQPGVLHLGCHATAGQSPDRSMLILTGGTLPVSRILAQAYGRPADAPGGLVILAACESDLALRDHDEAVTLASAFLAAGAASVIGARWDVSDLQTALMMFVLHEHLVRQPDDSPADALRAAQLWMLDPHRQPPAGMPEDLASWAGRPDLADVRAWAAYVHHGR